MPPRADTRDGEEEEGADGTPDAAAARGGTCGVVESRCEGWWGGVGSGTGGCVRVRPSPEREARERRVDAPDTRVVVVVVRALCTEVALCDTRWALCVLVNSETDEVPVAAAAAAAASVVVMRDV